MTDEKKDTERPPAATPEPAKAEPMPEQTIDDLEEVVVEVILDNLDSLGESDADAHEIEELINHPDPNEAQAARIAVLTWLIIDNARRPALHRLIMGLRRSQAGLPPVE